MKTLLKKMYDLLQGLHEYFAINTQVKPNYLLIKVNQKRHF